MCWKNFILCSVVTESSNWRGCSRLQKRKLNKTTSYIQWSTKWNKFSKCSHYSFQLVLYLSKKPKTLHQSCNKCSKMFRDIKKVIALFSMLLKVRIVKLIQYYCVLCHLRSSKPSCKVFTFDLSFQVQCHHLSMKITKNKYYRKSISGKNLFSVTVWNLEFHWL